MIERVAVLGAGTMGAGIAQVAAQAGMDVILYDLKPELLERGVGGIRKSLEARVGRGKMETAEMEEILARIATTVEREGAADADLVIEAAPEDLALKRDIFAALSGKLRPGGILATNTSSLSVTSIASAASAPSRVVGMHFFNPAPAMPLVEVIGAAQTSEDTVEAVRQAALAMGKTVVRAADTPGFIVNRVARPFYGEALQIVGEGTATVAQVDDALRLAGFRMGPFELMDLIGIDINFAVTRSVFDAFFGEPRYRPHLIQKRMVDAGTLGRKTGRGFYAYADGERREVAFAQVINLPERRSVTFIPEHITTGFLEKAAIDSGQSDSTSREVIVRILTMIMNEAAWAVGDGVASVRDVDIAMKLGTNYPKGPLKWADEIGLEMVHSVLKALMASQGDQRYRPAPLLWQLVRSGATGDAVGEGFHSPGEKGMV